MYQKFKKSLGQNFLIDKNIQKKIINACQLIKNDVVLEIGSGRGELTRSICNKVLKVYAIEIDRSLCRILKDNLQGYNNLTIINKDVLKFDLNKYFHQSLMKLKVIGNLPYYITSPIIERLAKYRNLLDIIYITVQKEFAARIIASAGARDYGSFSCFVQYYFKPRELFRVKKTSFLPQPKVNSSFLCLELNKDHGLNANQETLLFKIIRAAFSMRRKTLRNSLKQVISEEKLQSFFAKYGINPQARAEELSLNDFKNLART